MRAYELIPNVWYTQNNSWCDLTISILCERHSNGIHLCGSTNGLLLCRIQLKSFCVALKYNPFVGNYNLIPVAKETIGILLCRITNGILLCGSHIKSFCGELQLDSYCVGNKRNPSVQTYKLVSSVRPSNRIPFVPASKGRGGMRAGRRKRQKRQKIQKRQSGVPKTLCFYV